ACARLAGPGRCGRALAAQGAGVLPTACYLCCGDGGDAMSGTETGGGAERLRLGPLEQQVMEQLWERGELTVRELISQLGDRHAYTTIATVLTNLDRKGLVAHRRVGRSAHYGPRLSRAEHAARLMGEAL